MTRSAGAAPAPPASGGTGGRMGPTQGARAAGWAQGRAPRIAPHAPPPLLRAPGKKQSLGQGAATQTYLAVSPTAEGLGGEYFADCNLSPSSPASHDEALAARLWEMSSRMCGFKDE